MPYISTFGVNSLWISLHIHHQISTGRSTLDLDTFGLGTSTVGSNPELVYSVLEQPRHRRGPLSLADAYFIVESRLAGT